MKILWVRREPVLDGGGDAIVDAKFTRALAAEHEVAVHTVARLPRARALRAVLTRRVPPDRGAFGTPADVEAVARAAAGCDAVVFSHEQLDALARETGRRLGARRPHLSLLLHNVPSDMLPQVASSPAAGRLAGRLWSAFEARSFADRSIDRVFTLSHRDAGLVRRLAGRGDDVTVVHPGAPPATGLSPAAAFAPDLVLIGTFEWFPKLRDIKAFAEDYAAWPTTPKPRVYLSASADRAWHAALGAGEVESVDFSSAIRVGLVTDRFVAGHKLKVSEYFARNLVPVSYADVAEDFAFSRAARELIARVSGAGDIAAVIERLSAMRREDLHALYTEAKADVLQEMSWPRQAGRIAGAILSDIGAREREAAA